MRYDHVPHEPEGAPLGSAAEEAARLIEALRSWVDDRGFSAATVPGDSSACQLCPICQFLAIFRHGQPEVYEHLGHAADSVLAAVRASLSAHEAHWSQSGQPDVEHIDID